MMYFFTNPRWKLRSYNNRSFNCWCICDFKW